MLQRMPYGVLRVGAALIALAHFLCFAGVIPWWRLSHALPGGSQGQIVRAYLVALVSAVWGSVATAVFWLQLRQWLALRFGDTAALGAERADFDVGAAVASSTFAPRFLVRLHRRRLEEDEIERAVERLVVEKGTVSERARRTLARGLSSFAVGGCVMIGLGAPIPLLGALPAGVPYGVLIAAGVSSSLVLATALAYPAYHVLRAMRCSASLRLRARINERAR